MLFSKFYRESGGIGYICGLPKTVSDGSESAYRVICLQMMKRNGLSKTRNHRFRIECTWLTNGQSGDQIYPSFSAYSTPIRTNLSACQSQTTTISFFLNYYLAVILLIIACNFQQIYTDNPIRKVNLETGCISYFFPEYLRPKQTQY